MQTFKMLIDGELVGSQQTLDVLNPADETVIAACARATPADAERAVAAARKAFPAWSSRPLAERRAILLKVADVLEAHAPEIQRLVTQEQGKPLEAAAMESAWSPGIVRYYANFDFQPEIVQDDETQRVELHRRPIGVVAAIVPWNFPYLMAVYKLAPALIAGNTIVIKPSPTTPLATLRMAELIADIVPPGVVNVVTDAGDIGPVLTGHPDVAKVSFTGSTQTGRKVMESAASTIKRVTLELGGNDAAIVLDDVDVNKVAPQIFAMAFVNSGQVCMSIKRIYVQAGIHDAMCAELAALAEAAVIGNGLEQGVQFGPVQNAAQFRRVEDALEVARRDGKIIAGGQTRRPGYFLQPTIVRDIDESSPIVSEEVFGPLRSVLKFDTVDEAVRRANDSLYGLGASVWSSNVALATEIAGRLEAGSAWVNQHFAVGPHIPFGGVKQSGLGREFSREGLHEYTNLQSLVIAKAAPLAA